MKKTTAGFVTFAAVLAITLLGHTNAFAFALPGITPSGSPAFTNNVLVRLNPQGGLKVIGAANQTFSLDTGSDTYVGTRGLYMLNAKIGDDGSLLSGSVELRGMMSQLGIDRPRTLLMSADLTAANLVDDPHLWGFNTTNIFCNPDLMLNCTDNESVYLSLSNSFSGDFGRNFISRGIAVTTVPVPAAVWLFGSGLGLLGWIRRRSIGVAG
jgi:hypothetical protein